MTAEKALEIINECFSGDPVVASDSFKDLPCDSLEYLFLAQQVEKETGLKFPDEALVGFVEVGDMAKWMVENS